MVSSCWVLVTVVCAIVQAAPQSSGGSSSSSSSNKPNTRLFSQQQGFGHQGSFGNQGFGSQGGFGVQNFGNQGSFGNQGFGGQGGFGVQNGFNQQAFQGFGGVTVPPNTPVNVVNPNNGAVVGVPIQQCSFFCRLPSGQYGCCDNQQQSHPGQCPTPRPSCPPTRNFGVGPKFCSIDIDCQYPNKCCLDTCLEGRVCKPGLFG